MIPDQYTESRVSLFKLRLTAAREAATLLQLREGGREGAAGGEESSEILVANRDILGTCSLLIGIILSIYAIISEGRSSLATARFILTSSSIKRRQT